MDKIIHMCFSESANESLKQAIIENKVISLIL